MLRGVHGREKHSKLLEGITTEKMIWIKDWETAERQPLGQTIKVRNSAQSRTISAQSWIISAQSLPISA